MNRLITIAFLFLFLPLFAQFQKGDIDVLNERVQEISKEKDNWKVVTSKNKTFIAPNVIIAGGVGSFEPYPCIADEESTS